MKKYNSLTHIVGLACAVPDFHRVRNEPAGLRPRRYRLIQVICSSTALQISGAISALSSQLMARMWEALPRAEATVAICRQVSTQLSSGVDPNLSGKPVRRHKTLTVQAGQTYSYTAGWSGRRMALVANQGQTVPTY